MHLPLIHVIFANTSNVKRERVNHVFGKPTTYCQSFHIDHVANIRSSLMPQPTINRKLTRNYQILRAVLCLFKPSANSRQEAVYWDESEKSIIKRSIYSKFLIQR